MSRTEWLLSVAPSRPAAGDKPAASAVFRSVESRDGFPTIEATTLYELLQHSVKKYPNNKALGYRPKTDGKVGNYEWLTYQQISEKVDAVASGLADLGVGKGDRVGVYGANCPEWMIAMQVGALFHALYLTSMYMHVVTCTYKSA